MPSSSTDRAGTPQATQCRTSISQLVLRSDPPSEDEVRRALEEASDDEFRALVAGASIDETEFEPLGTEADYLAENELGLLADSWKTGPPPQGWSDEQSAVLAEWRQALDSRRVAAYCAAAGALIRGLLLDASAEEEATGEIKSPHDKPVVRIFALPRSVLADEEGLGEAGGTVSFDASRVARQIALRCNVPVPWGELAWRCLASSLAAGDAENVLPRVASRRRFLGRSIEVRLASPTT